MIFYFYPFVTMIYCRLSFVGSGRNTSVPMKGDPLLRLAYRWNIFSKQMQDKGSVKVFSAVRYNLGSVYYTPVFPVLNLQHIFKLSVA